MTTVTRTPPPRPDDDHDAEALAALIEEARRRARRRRRAYAASALAAAALLGFYAFDNDRDGDGASRSSDRAEPREAGAGVRDGRWRVTPGLEGATINELAVDPKHPDTVFAATSEAGVFKSTNGGRSWRHLDLGREVSRVDRLAIAPGKPQTVYAATGQGVLTTTNGGRSWQATGAGILASALAVDPRDPEVAYAGTWERGFFKTEDGGRSWRGLGPRIPVNTLAFQPGTSGFIYAGAERGVYRSRDGGATWHPAGLRSEYVTTLALDPKHPLTMYAGVMVDHFSEGTGTGTASGAIFKTTDGGASWRRTRDVREPITGLGINPRDTDVVYAETWGTLLKTADGGRTGQSLEAGDATAAASQTVALDPRNPETIYVGTGDNPDHGGGVSKSVDGGRSWRLMNAGLTAARVSALAVAPGGRGTAYATVLGRGVFKRVDGRWRAANAGLTPDEVHVVAVDPRHPANVYAGTDGGVFRSANGGASWSASSLTKPLGRWPADGRLSALAVDPKNSRIVYSIAVWDATATGGGPGTYEGLVFKSMDGGHSWPTLESVQTVDVPGTPGEFVTTDEFATTDRHTSPLAIDPRDPQVLYAGGRGVNKSGDGGLTWRTSGLGPLPVLGLAVDPSETKVLYAGTDAGLFKSTNAGATWQSLHGALDGARVGALAVDPQHHRTVYAGTETGVFWSTDGGRRWHRFTRLPHLPFHALAVDRSADLLYAGAHGGGIFELKLRR